MSCTLVGSAYSLQRGIKASLYVILVLHNAKFHDQIVRFIIFLTGYIYHYITKCLHDVRFQCDPAKHQREP